jgi:hypothetical protein
MSLATRLEVTKSLALVREMAEYVHRLASTLETSTLRHRQKLAPEMARLRAPVPKSLRGCTLVFLKSHRPRGMPVVIVPVRPGARAAESIARMSGYICIEIVELRTTYCVECSFPPPECRVSTWFR